MAHITGGGIPGNLVRILPEGLKAVINRGSWPVLPVFSYLQDTGGVADAAMYDAFNMGIGYVLIVSPSFTRSIMAHLRKLGETPYFIGKVKRGSGKVVLK